MTNDVRRCDVCGTVFNIAIGYWKYNQTKLPAIHILHDIITQLNSNAREYIHTWNCDVCADCLIAIYKAMLARKELDNG